MDYKIRFEGDCTVVTVNYGNDSVDIKFEGKKHEEKAMEFISTKCMVQMGQIGI